MRRCSIRTIRNLRVIVIDDGSSDTHYRSPAMPTADIASGRVTVLTKPNCRQGRGAQLRAATSDREEIYVGIDADTVIAHDAISRLVPHFSIRRSERSPATPRSATG